MTLRVRSYLHSNCAQCHVNAGGGNAQIQLDIATNLDKAKLIDVAPLHDKFGKTDVRLVAPGSPERSILLHRLSIRGRGQMPQLATTIVDQRAVDLVRHQLPRLETGEIDQRITTQRLGKLCRLGPAMCTRRVRFSDSRSPSP